MSNFWGAAAEGFNQGLGYAMRRAEQRRAEEQQRLRDQQMHDWQVEAADRAARMEREAALFRRDLEDPVSGWFPNAVVDPIQVAATGDVGLLGGVRRRSDELHALDVAERQKRLDDKRWELPPDSVALPDDPKWSAYPSVKSPEDGRAYRAVPRDVAYPRQSYGGGGGSPINSLIPVPLSAMNPEHQALYAELDYDGDGVVELPHSIAVKVRKNVPSFSNTQAAMKAMFGDEKYYGIVPGFIDDRLSDDARSALSAVYADTYGKTGSQQEAISAALAGLNLPSMFPDLTLERDGRIKYNKSWLDKRYGVNDEQRFIEEYRKDEDISPEFKSALFRAVLGVAPPAAEKPKEEPKKGAPPEEAIDKAVFDWRTPAGLQKS